MEQQYQNKETRKFCTPEEVLKAYWQFVHDQNKIGGHSPISMMEWINNNYEMIPNLIIVDYAPQPFRPITAKHRSIIENMSEELKRLFKL